jgi:hypothetical protein
MAPVRLMIPTRQTTKKWIMRQKGRKIPKQSFWRRSMRPGTQAAHALREKSIGASHAKDPDDVDMRI